jgi:ectoine hydroxylase-related dioxygenase (phytanoyl-CoA dioxygenase family)
MGAAAADAAPEEAWHAPCVDDDAPPADAALAAAPAPSDAYAHFKRLPRRSARRAAAAAAVDARVWQALYPPLTPVPLDADGFALSFACPDSPERVADGGCAEALAFYRAHGYVVFRDALTAAECAASRGEIWDALERDTPGVRRDVPSTWGALSSDTYGLAPTPSVFSAQLLANRQSPRVVGALAALLRADAAAGAPQRDGLLVSQDRWCFYRPTRAGALLGEDHPEWSTRQNLHLDLHPWAYRQRDAQCVAALEALRFEHLRDFSKETNWVNAASGPHLQGVIALAPNAAADGGTQLVPGFAASFDAWVDALGGVEHHSDATARAAAAAGDDSRPWLIPRAAGGGSFKFAPTDPLCSRAQRVPLRAGALLVWDQRTAHGACGNDSGAPRYAQFVKAFRTRTVSDARVAARARAVEREARAAGSWHVITPLGRRVFGLDWVPDGADSSGGGGDAPRE